MSTSNATIGIPLLKARSSDGAPLSAYLKTGVFQNNDQKTGTFQLLPTPAGGFALVSESPKGTGDTVNDTALLSVVVPPNYVAGSSALAVNLSVASVPNKGNGLAVLSGSSISISVSRLNSDGSVSAIPVTTAAQNLPAVGANVNAPNYSVISFELNGTSVNSGDQLLIYVQVQFGVTGEPPFQANVQICLAQLVAAVQNYQAD